MVANNENLPNTPVQGIIALNRLFFGEKAMESEKMVDIQYFCKCGALVTGKAARQFTDAEMAALKQRDCGVCYLKNLLEKDLKQIDEENCA